MPKFLIYNQNSVSKQSKADLSTLLQDVFTDQSNQKMPDISDWYLDQNLDGLKPADLPTF